jgi:hypothetical protein
MARFLSPKLTMKYPISALPLAKKSQLLIHNLTPDPHTPSVEEFRTKILTEKASLQRRARVRYQTAVL